MKATEITNGMTFLFTPTGKEFKVAKVTDKRISWYVDAHKSGWGRNTMKMAWVSIRQFQNGLNSGAYKLIEK